MGKERLVVKTSKGVNGKAKMLKESQQYPEGFGIFIAALQKVFLMKNNPGSFNLMPVMPAYAIQYKLLKADWAAKLLNGNIVTVKWDACGVLDVGQLALDTGRRMRIFLDNGQLALDNGQEDNTQAENPPTQAETEMDNPQTDTDMVQDDEDMLAFQRCINNIVDDMESDDDNVSATPEMPFLSLQSKPQL